MTPVRPSPTRAIALTGCLALAFACNDRDLAAAPAPAEPEHPEPKADPPKPCPSFADLDVTTLPALPESRYADTLDAVWKRVLEKHYDPTLGCVDWPAVRERYAAKLAGVDDQAQAYRVINEMLGELDQSHFRLFAPVGESDQPGPTAPPLQVRWVGAELVVVRSDASTAVPPGSVLVAVEGEAVDVIVDRVKAEHFGKAETSAFAFDVARAVEARLSCERSGMPRKLRIREPSDATVDKTVTCEEPEGELVSLGHLQNLPTRVEHRMIEGTKVGYLAFNIWMLPMVQRVTAALDDLRRQGMQALVLDLRGNPGGVGPMSVPVARLFLDRPAKLGELRFRGFEQAFNVAPGDDPFTGPVAVLVDEGTASTSEIFVAGLRELGRITVVGARSSAGAALPSVIERLDGGAVLQYVVGDFRTPQGTVAEGSGIAPDVMVSETRADYARGADPVLAAAVEHLQKK